MYSCLIQGVRIKLSNILLQKCRRNTYFSLYIHVIKSDNLFSMIVGLKIVAV